MQLISSKQGFSVYPITVPTKYNVKTFNFYLWDNGNSLSLIDAGLDSKECWEQLNSTLSENGFTLDDISQIILTHTHEDHIGLINRILTKRKVPIYAHSKSIPYLKRDKDFLSFRIEFFKQLYKEMGCGDLGISRVEKLIKAVQERENYSIQTDIISLSESDIISGLQVIETPGHAPDHLVFYYPKKKWLLGGDHIIGHISSNALVEPDSEGRRILTLVEYIQSLEKCLKFNIDTVYAGHGRLITNPKELISTRLMKISQKSDQILSLIISGISTADQLAQTYYKDKYQKEFELVMSDIIGYLDYLEFSNKIKKELKNSVWQYSQL
ncbi:MBL fold metallo-hydrolase [Peribacillus butanolivorans]|uniref:MBL fold metallo-hydrolase n=1 Tax=Peribacillus butanolivorans TaxID=421767 RepID=UPI003697BE1E